MDPPSHSRAFDRENRMKYFFLSLCLVVLWTCGSVVAGISVKITQEPNPARSGGNVTVTCTATETADLQWKVSNGTVVKFNTKGVTKTQGATSNILQVDLSVFPYEMTMSCGVKDDNHTWKNYTICVSWGIIRPPQDIIVHEADENPKTMSCLVVEKCVASPNPWFYQNGTQVANNSGITVNRKLVDGTSTVIEWELQFADLKQEDSYTCRASLSTTDTAPSFSATATLKAAVTSSIKIPPQNVTVKKGSLVPSRMTCVIVGDYDGAKTPWTHNNDVVKNGSGVTVERLLVGDGVVVHWLTFVNVMNDSIFGIYTCGVESDGISATATLINETPESSTTDPSTSSEDASSASASNTSSPQPTATAAAVAPNTTTPTDSSAATSPSVESRAPNASKGSENESSTGVSNTSSQQPTTIAVTPTTTTPTDSSAATSPSGNPKGHQPVSIVAIAVAVVVILVLCGAVFLVYWKRHALREWLMEKDVVKVMKKGKRGKGYKYSKLPRDISTSMKHLE